MQISLEKGSSSQTNNLRHSITLLALLLAVSAEYWTSAGVSLTLPDLTGSVGASSDEASWALTVYTTAFSVSVALSHRLSVFFGNRKYLAVCGLGVAAASLGCSVSLDLPTFLAFRALGGFAGGAFLVRSFVFFTQNIPAADRARIVTNFAIEFFVIGRVLANIVSGWLADNATWRYLFAVPALLALVASALFAFFSADHWRTAEDPGERVDLFGMALLVIGATTLQTALSRGETDNWFDSSFIRICFGLGIASNVLFLLWQLSPRNHSPLLDLRYLRVRTLYGGSALAFALGMLLSGSLYVIPQYLRVIESHSALQSGMLLSIGSASTVLVTWLLLRFQKVIMRTGARAVIAAALLIEMVSQVFFAQVLTPDMPDYLLWFPIILNGAFLALSIPTLGTATFMAVDESETSSARAIFYGIRQFGASLGVTLAAVVIDRRASLHSSRLFEGFFSRNLATIGQSGDLTPLGAKTLDVLIRKQSLVLSFADVFYVMAAISACALLLVPVLPSATTVPNPPSSKAAFPKRSTVAEVAQ